MRRSTHLILLCLTLLLVLLTVAVGKPGLPMTLKADEPAYYLMALSLAHDFDLECETADLGRIFDEYPYLAAFNVILMTDDAWQTVFFGKPYIFSLFAAPLAGVFGANGIVAFNMLLLMAMVWMGSSYLSRFNSDAIAALYACGFFLLSAGFAYVFWLHPEIFNMAAIMASLYLVLHQFDDAPSVGRWQRWRQALFGPRLRPAWSGALLALAIYNKPMLAAMALPTLFAFWRRGERRSILVWIVACLAGLILICGVSIALTGHASAYLGVERMGVPVFDPHQMPIAPVTRDVSQEAPTTNSWFWLIRIPDIKWSKLFSDVGYFFWGRHTGLMPYMPFALISLILFLIHGRRSAVRWLVLVGAASVAVFFLVWIPFNWHGGGGFVGNRYFVNVYPALLFLVTTIRPVLLTAVGYAVAGLFVGPILFTPFGAPVPEPTLQAHVRNPPFRWLPLELGFRRKLPGYKGVGVSGAYFFGRKDVIEVKNDEIRIHGATPVELWMLTSEPLEEPIVVLLRNLAPENRLTIDFAGHRTELDFAAEEESAVGSRRLELTPGKKPRRLDEDGKILFAYRVLVETSTGSIPNAAENAATKFPVNDFYFGVGLTFLGTPSELARDLYQVDWEVCDLPATVPAGQPFEVTTRVRNASQEVWPAIGPTRVNLSYHWHERDSSGSDRDGRRTNLAGDVGPGQSVELVQMITAPESPGEYELELDLVRERVSWFSQKQADSSCRAGVEVSAAAATEDSPEP